MIPSAVYTYRSLCSHASGRPKRLLKQFGVEMQVSTGSLPLEKNPCPVGPAGDTFELTGTP